MGLYISAKVIDRTLEEVLLRPAATVLSYVLAGVFSQIPVSVAQTALTGVYAHLAGRPTMYLMGKIVLWSQGREERCAQSRTCRKIDQFLRSRTYNKIAQLLAGQVGVGCLLGTYLLFNRGTESEVLTDKDLLRYTGWLCGFLAFGEWLLNGGANRICGHRDEEIKKDAFVDFAKQHKLCINGFLDFLKNPTLPPKVTLGHCVKLSIPNLSDQELSIVTKRNLLDSQFSEEERQEIRERLARLKSGSAEQKIDIPQPGEQSDAITTPFLQPGASEGEGEVEGEG